MQHQKLLLQLANSQIGRHLLGITRKEPIVKLSPNGIIFLLELRGKTQLREGYFYLYDKVDRALRPYLEGIVLQRQYKINEVLPFLEKFAWARRSYIPHLGLTITNYNDTAGDGSVGYQAAVSYATAHDTATGTHVNGGFGCGQSYNGQFYVTRFFAPADTSALTVSATITAATWNFWPDGVRNGDTGDVRLVSTTQSSTSSLATSDYNKCGDAVSNPTTDSTTLLSALTAGQYNAITLGATSRGWLSKTGVTKIGLRLGKDCTNTSPPTGGNNDTDLYPGIELSGAAHPAYYAITYTVPSSGGAFLLNFM